MQFWLEPSPLRPGRPRRLDDDDHDDDGYDGDDDGDDGTTRATPPLKILALRAGLVVGEPQAPERGGGLPTFNLVI